MNLARWLRYGGLAAAGSVLALAVRWPLLDYLHGDFLAGFASWYGFLAANGDFAALRHDFYEYTPSYLYLLAAAARFFPDAEVFAIKGISIGFDFAQALLVGMCVRLRAPKSAALPVLAGLAALLAPAVVVNGAVIGQSDGIFTTFLVLCLYCLLRRRPAPAFAAFGLAFALKPQAVFLLPFFWWIRQQEPPSRNFSRSFSRSFVRSGLLLPPLVYLAALLPAWALGRPFGELALLRFGQVDTYRRLDAGAPNPYAWLPDRIGADLYVWWPLFAALVVAGVAALGLVIRRSRAAPTPDLGVTLAVLAMFATPYLLPSMHERYFYPAAVLSIVLAFRRPRFAALPVFLGFASFLAEVAHPAFGWDRVAVARAGAAVLALLLAGLLRRLLRDLGVRSPLRAGWRRLREQARARRAEAAPLLVLVGCLAAVFALGQLGGRFDRPVGDDAARTLAQVENLSSDHSFVPHSRRRLAADGAVVYEGAVRGAPAPYFLLRAVTLHFEDDRGAQLRAARVTTAGFSALAALLAYLALARLFRRRWVALGATLLAFSSFAGGGWDTVSAEGAPALCSLFLCFHGLAAFVRDGRPGPLLLKTGAALALSFVAFWLIAPFLVFAVVERARRQVSGGEGGRAPSRDGGVRRIRPARLALLAGFAALFGGALAGLGAANEAALRAGGARLASAAIDGGGGGGGGGGAETLQSLTAALLPDAFRGDGAGAVLVGGSVAAVGLLGAAGSGRRRLLLPLALASLLPALPGLGAFGVAPPVGVPLVAAALGLAALRRRRAVAVGVGISLAVFLGSASPTSGGSGSGFGSVPSPEYRRTTASEARIEDRIAADFAEIRQFLRRRPEELTVFAPASLLPEADSAAAEIAWRLAGNTRVYRSRGRRLRLGTGWGASRSRGWILLLEEGEDRGLAEFVIDRGRRSGPGLLTPRNRELFLHHRAALDGEVDRMIESAGTPLWRGEFDLYRAGDDLLYAREPCSAGDTRGTFVLHFDPVETSALPPFRRQYGFDNRSFHFSWGVLERGERCVARVPLPDYAIRRLVTGRHSGRPGEDFAWRAEIAPFP